MHAVPMQTLGSVHSLDLGRHMYIGGFAGSIGLPAVVDAVEVYVVEAEGTVAVAGRGDVDDSGVESRSEAS